jgi:hypothetical protein
MQRYINDNEKQMKKSKREISRASDDDKKGENYHREKRTEAEENRDNPKRQHT